MMYRGNGPIRRLPPGKKRGFARLGFVIAVLWFGYWGLRAFLAYQDYDTANSAIDYIGQYSWKQEAWDRFIGNIIAAFALPVIASVLILVTRWVLRGFRDPKAD